MSIELWLAFVAAAAGQFLVLEWLGAAYLVCLGVRLWRTPAVPTDPAAGACPCCA